MTLPATILLVEDDQALLDGIADLLEVSEIGYDVQVLKAKDGQMGLRVLASSDPDLIISDIMMPRMGGYEFLEQVRQTTEWVHIPIIFLTAKGTKHDVLRGRMSGAELYIKKPYDSEELLQLVKSQLDRAFELRVDRERKVSTMSRNIVQLLHHEFRTPLTYVTAYYDMLANGIWQEDDDSVREYLEGIHVGAQRMSNLVSNLLTVLSIWTGDAAEVYGEEAGIIDDPGTIVNSLCEQFSAEIKQDNETFSCEIEPDLPGCYGVPQYIQEILRQLLLNAFAFARRASEGRPEVRLTVSADNDWLKLTISDNGVGIPTVAHDRIFELFYQHDRAELEQQGAGAGLTIVQGLTELHGGQIDVESEPGEGSIFTVSLPVYRVDEAELMLKEPGGAPSATVLLVEDEEFLLRGLKDLLETYGTRYQLTIVTAKDGLEALDALGQVTPDLIITDIMMPRMNGYQFLTEVRANPSWVDIPVIFLTARGERQDILLGLSSGAEEYVTKPYDVDELFGVVSTQLDRHFLRRGAAKQNLEELKVGVLELLMAEFQVPLADVRQYTDRVSDSLSKVGSMEELQTYLQGLEEASNHVAHLVADFILLVELRTGQSIDWFTLQAKPINVNNVLQATGPLLQAGHDWLEVEIRYNLDSRSDTALIDGQLLGKCLERLSEVIISRCPNDRPVKLVLVSEAEDSHVWLKIGSADAQLSDEMFSGIRDALSDPRPFVPELRDFSLALVLVKGIVHFHNGQLLVESGPGRGLTIVISLPAYND